jgi:hypothetical protein
MMMMFAEMYMNNLTKDQFNGMALENGISLSNDELDFSFNFIKSNLKDVLANKDDFDLSIYKNKFSNENYEKILQLINVLKDKYGNLF